MYWINGVPKKTISLNVRALHFGDGFFTTAKVRNKKIDFLNWHMERLILSAKKLMFQNLDFNIIKIEMLEAAYIRVNGIIKIIISRKNRQQVLGYKCQNDMESIRIIYTDRLPQRCIRWNKFGLRLQTSIMRLSCNPGLAGIKHLNRLEQVMISTYISHSNVGKDYIADEALVLDIYGNVVECCSANIFWRKKYKVFTPAICYSGVNGIIRQLVIKLLPILGYSIYEVTVSVEHLKDADEVFITNSLLPLASVYTIDNNHYSSKTLFNILNSHVMYDEIYIS